VGGGGWFSPPPVTPRGCHTATHRRQGASRPPADPGPGGRRRGMAQPARRRREPAGTRRTGRVTAPTAGNPDRTGAQHDEQHAHQARREMIPTPREISFHFFLIFLFRLAMQKRKG
jgi:hypothetical protein